MRKRVSKILFWKEVMYKGLKYLISIVFIRIICINED